MNTPPITKSNKRKQFEDQNFDQASSGAISSKSLQHRPGITFPSRQPLQPHENATKNLNHEEKKIRAGGATPPSSGHASAASRGATKLSPKKGSPAKKSPKKAPTRPALPDADRLPPHMFDDAFAPTQIAILPRPSTTAPLPGADVEDGPAPLPGYLDVHEEDYMAFCSQAYLQSTAPPQETAVVPVAPPSEENFWHLPEAVRDIYNQRNINTFYEWQKVCLNHAEVLSGANLIFSLPTSGGKTLVAEIHLMRCVLLQRKKALLILPYVSIVTEKTRSLSEFGAKLKFAVEPYYNSHGIMPMPCGNQVAICTIEKANAVINHLIEENRLDEVGTVVIDELHMVGDGERGVILELLLTKLVFCCKNIQIIGMSATTGPNLEKLSAWLHAHSYQDDFRPVELRQFVVCRPSKAARLQVLNAQWQLVRDLSKETNDSETLLYSLCSEVVPNASVLIFCPTKADTEATAKALIRKLPPQTRDIFKQEREQLLSRLKFETEGDESNLLRETILFGVAFHHSGVTVPERELIEEAFVKKIICIIACTSTLAAGVNLPARRVIIKSPFTGKEQLTTRKYVQMCGRGGRAGIDPFGESYLLCTDKRSEGVAKCLVGMAPEDVDSQLTMNMKKSPEFGRLILDAICGAYAKTASKLVSLVSHTLMAVQQRPRSKEIAKAVAEVLASLQEKGFITAALPDGSGSGRGSPAAEKPDVEYAPTDFGQATYRSSFPLSEAVKLRKELERAQDVGLVLTDDLHLCYLVTPLSGTYDPDDWSFFDKAFISKLSAVRRRILDAVGLQENYIAHRIGAPKDDSPLASTARRFYNALMLAELIRGQAVWEVAKNFRTERGAVEALMQSASMFAHQTVMFCRRMKWWHLELLLTRYVKQLSFGVTEDMLQLVEIPGVKSARAKALWRGDYRTVQQIANADPAALARKVRLGPFGEGVARKIVAAAKALLETKASALREEAQRMLSDLPQGQAPAVL